MAPKKAPKAPQDWDKNAQWSPNVVIMMLLYALRQAAPRASLDFGDIAIQLNGLNQHFYGAEATRMGFRKTVSSFGVIDPEVNNLKDLGQTDVPGEKEHKMAQAQKRQERQDKAKTKAGAKRKHNEDAEDLIIKGEESDHEDEGDNEPNGGGSKDHGGVQAGHEIQVD